MDDTKHDDDDDRSRRWMELMLPICYPPVPEGAPWPAISALICEAGGSEDVTQDIYWKTLRHLSDWSSDGEKLARDQVKARHDQAQTIEAAAMNLAALLTAPGADGLTRWHIRPPVEYTDEGAVILRRGDDETSRALDALPALLRSFEGMAARFGASGAGSEKRGRPQQRAKLQALFDLIVIFDNAGLPVTSSDTSLLVKVARLLWEYYGIKRGDPRDGIRAHLNFGAKSGPSESESAQAAGPPATWMGAFAPSAPDDEGEKFTG